MADIEQGYEADVDLGSEYTQERLISKAKRRCKLTTSKYKIARKKVQMKDAVKDSSDKAMDATKWKAEVLSCLQKEYHKCQIEVRKPLEIGQYGNFIFQKWNQVYGLVKDKDFNEHTLRKFQHLSEDFRKQIVEWENSYGSNYTQAQLLQFCLEYSQSPYVSLQLQSQELNISRPVVDPKVEDFCYISESSSEIAHGFCEEFQVKISLHSQRNDQFDIGKFQDQREQLGNEVLPSLKSGFCMSIRAAYANGYFSEGFSAESDCYDSFEKQHLVQGKTWKDGSIKELSEDPTGLDGNQLENSEECDNDSQKLEDHQLGKIDDKQQKVNNCCDSFEEQYFDQDNTLEDGTSEYQLDFGSNQPECSDYMVNENDYQVEHDENNGPWFQEEADFHDQVEHDENNGPWFQENADLYGQEYPYDHGEYQTFDPGGMENPQDAQEYSSSLDDDQRVFPFDPGG